MFQLPHRIRSGVSAMILALGVAFLATGCDGPSAAPIAIQTPPARQTEAQIEQQKIEQQIVQLESQVAAHPDQLDFAARNDLRHLYLVQAMVSMRKAMEHCNAILATNVMDWYTLNSLLGWQIAEDGKIKEPMRGRNLALGLAEQFPEFPHLSAACWIIAGDAAATDDEARIYYNRVVNSGNAELERYAAAAQEHEKLRHAPPGGGGPSSR